MTGLLRLIERSISAFQRSARMKRLGELELEITMNSHRTRYFVLVSKQIPYGFFPFEIGQSDADPWSLLDGWEYRSYEVPSPGSLERVEVTGEDVFIIQASGSSINDISGDDISFGPNRHRVPPILKFAWPASWQCRDRSF
ncbi:MAG: hypothetical protein ABJF86_11860 [Tateyamaria sp.]|uniref:hypothetical protein n=1 Tax=Alphaproteobacteria TaxID=28211 RepID=UPI00328F1125